MRCNAKTATGRRCKANARKGMKVCLFHAHSNRFTGTPARETTRNIRKYNRKK